MSSLIYSKIILPFIEQFTCDSVLLTGNNGESHLAEELNNTRSYTLSSPFQLEQFERLPQIDLAIIGDLIETTPKKQAMAWLGLLKNRHCQHILLLVDMNRAETQGWQLTDFLGLGFRLTIDSEIAAFTYNIKDYQFKKDWLNNRFWANPDNFDKFRW